MKNVFSEPKGNDQSEKRNYNPAFEIIGKEEICSIFELPDLTMEERLEYFSLIVPKKDYLEGKLYLAKNSWLTSIFHLKIFCEITVIFKMFVANNYTKAFLA